ncbi:hypothetical protein D7B24_005031 [Verticillium nonalfalfae]|uniref:Aminoglycoside phosphotransferase domain-containing protein n=1 Tax=Verticillium nonalfalfae TaxID=1051616 RepID=A0A3M9YK22_9PEZI|nr:uncharacterized protein D7B24_005031 [Verticillium nonalfalfae]RNJ60943.1 hypothetical protein D7B24_005031 [Verticillium nonalfalfae]
MAPLYLPPGYDFDAQHDGTEHLAINNTWLRRFLTRLALRTTAKFYSRDGLCVPISNHRIVKTGIRTHLTEVMERIQGDELPAVLNVLSPEALECFLQLRKFIQELRALKPLTTGVESCVGGSLFDSRIPRGNPRFGPFTTIKNFHFWLRDNLKPEDLQAQKRDQDWHDLQKMMDRQDGPCPPPVFTHGDLNPFNILVREGKVVGIIDWEFSGWYPPYWEYTSAWFGNITRLEWQSKLDKFLDRPPLEDFEMEKVRNKWWGEC